jgi:hypothetical protein
MFDLSLEDRIRLQGLGVRPDGEAAAAPWLERRRGKTDGDVIESLAQKLCDAMDRERRAWNEARRWRMWGWLGLACAAASVAAQVAAAIAQRGGW